jgi:hydroxyquinol 1,2-dioxygenase
VFLRDDPYIECDAVFAAQTSLQADFVRHEPGTAPDGTSVEEPFVTLDWTFTLANKSDE